MTKLDLIRELSDRLSLTQKDCTQFLDCFNEIAIEAFKQNDSLKLPGLGRLSPRHQSARPGRNPITGVECPITERIGLRFKASKGLLEALNNNKEEEAKG